MENGLPVRDTVVSGVLLSELEERAEGAELDAMVDAANRNPILKAILQWIDGAVVVLNRHRQIVMASPNLSQLLGIRDGRMLTGKRLGEAAGCMNADRGEAGCGTSPSCRYCGALGAIIKSQRQDEPVEAECRLATRTDKGVQSVKLRVSTARESMGRQDFIVLLIQPAGGEKASFEPGTRLWDEAHGWPTSAIPFTRIRKLGTGGMGNVFLVRDERGLWHALKTLRREVASSSTVADRFSQELQIAATLHHPNVVETYCTGETPAGAPYMVSEYCSNGSAEAWLQEYGPVPVETAIRWMIDTAQALGYLWDEHHLVHRDIKPGNLLIGRDHRLKVIDFGIAATHRRPDARLTQLGQFVGSASYMPPEQVLNPDDLDVRTDLYALGATFFELLIGTPPFDGANPGAILRSKQLRAAPRTGGARGDLPPLLAECIDSLLSQHREHRPDHPRQIVRRLQALAADGNLHD